MKTFTNFNKIYALSKTNKFLYLTHPNTNRIVDVVGLDCEYVISDYKNCFLKIGLPPKEILRFISLFGENHFVGLRTLRSVMSDNF